VDTFIAITEEILTIKAQYTEDNSQAFDIPELKVLLQQYNHEKLHEELLEISHSPVLSHRGTHLF
jgi:hypothetical protein